MIFVCGFFCAVEVVGDVQVYLQIYLQEQKHICEHIAIYQLLSALSFAVTESYGMIASLSVGIPIEISTGR